MHSARHVVKRIVNHRFLSYMASMTLASNICETDIARPVIQRALDPS